MRSGPISFDIAVNGLYTTIKIKERFVANCESIAGCPFFNEKTPFMPGTVEGLKDKYCFGDFSSCARHRVLKALGRARVPPDLFPTNIERANQLIAEG